MIGSLQQCGTIRPLGLPGDLGWIIKAHGEMYAAEFGWDTTFEALVARIAADFAACHAPATQTAWIAELHGQRLACETCRSRRTASSARRRCRARPAFSWLWDDAQVSVLITNIGELVTNTPRDAVSVAAPGPFEAMASAALVLDGGLVAWTGPARQAPSADAMVDAAGRTILPGFVDSHAHLVFAGERGAEFAARMAGVPYSAGGIRST